MRPRCKVHGYASRILQGDKVSDLLAEGWKAPGDLVASDGAAQVPYGELYHWVSLVEADELLGGPDRSKRYVDHLR